MESQKYSKCQTTTHIEKNKLLLNEYLGIFRPCFLFFIFMENDFFKPTHPTKVWKIHTFLILKPSLSSVTNAFHKNLREYFFGKKTI